MCDDLFISAWVCVRACLRSYVRVSLSAPLSVSVCLCAYAILQMKRMWHLWTKRESQREKKTFSDVENEVRVRCWFGRRQRDFIERSKEGKQINFLKIIWRTHSKEKNVLQSPTLVYSHCRLHFCRPPCSLTIPLEFNRHFYLSFVYGRMWHESPQYRTTSGACAVPTI